MADSDKNILISPQRGSTTDSPSITLTGDGNDPISIYALDGTVGALSFEASAGQLFSITNNLTSGSIFSVNDVSGIPSIDVNSSGTVQIAPFGGAVALGQTTVTTGTVFDVKGDVRIDGDLSITSTTLVSNLNADLLDGQQGSYYTGYTDTAIANLIDSSPGTLNTLNELAAALGDDASFSTTVTNSIATKLPKSGGQMTGNITFSGSQTVDGRDLSADGSKLDGIESGATADQTASEILTAIKTVDGSGSGLDADNLDGQQGSYYLNYNNFSNTPTIPTNNNQLTNGAGYVTSNTQLSNEQVQDIVGGMVSSNTESGITVTYQDGDGTIDFSVASQTDNNFTTTLKNKLDGIESGATADQTAAQILTAIKTVDGSGSGLDADTLDGLDSTQFLRSDTSDTMAGALTISGSTSRGSYTSASQYETGADNIVLKGNSVGRSGIFFESEKDGTNINHTSDFGFIQFHAYGTGSSGESNELIVGVSNDSDDHVILNAPSSTGLKFRTGNSATDYTIWHSGNDGASSGLDADKLDGQHGSYYTGYTDTAIANLIDSSPGTLNTLNELAAALGDDASFSTTVTNSIATKLPKSGGQMTGNITFSGSQTVDGRDVSADGTKLDGIESNATADQTAAEILTAIKTVDGSGSGLDADLLDGIGSGSFLRSDAADTATGTLTVRDIKFDAGYHLQRSDHHSGHLEGSYNNVGSNGSKTNPIYTIGSTYNPNSTTLSNMFGIGYTHDTASFISGTGFSGWGMYVAANGYAKIFLSGSNGTVASTGQHYVGSDVVWNAGNDGAGSGLDADLLDGQQGSYYLNYNNFTNTPTIPTNNNQLTNGAGYVTSNTQLSNEQVQDIVGGMVSSNTESGITVTYEDSDGTLDFSVASQTDNNFTTALKNKLDGIETGATADQTKADIDALNVDAGTLDGVDSTSFLRSDAADIKTSGNLTFNNNVRANFGTNNDLEIYHSSANGTIRNNTGSLYLRTYADNERVHIQSDDGSGGITDYFRANGSTGEAILYHYGAEKLATKSSGVTVTGTLTATSFSGDLTGTATTATNVTVTANNSTNETVYPVFVDGATGSQGAETDTGLNYNPSTGALTATSFSGSGASLTAVDADTLDGQQGSYYTDASNLGSGTIPDARFPATLPAVSGANLTNLPSSGVTVQDEGSALSTTATTLNFVGSGVVATGTGATKTITINGGGSSSLATAIYKGPSSSSIDVDSESYFTLDIDTAEGTPDSIFTNTNGVIELGAVGSFLVMGTCVIDSDASTSRWTGELELRQNSSTLGSVQGGYIRNSDDSNETYLSLSRIVTTTNSTSTIDFRIRKIGGRSSASVDLVQNLCTIQIIRLDGIPGTQGPAGADGADGTDGTDGTDGAPGPSDIPQNSQTSAYTLVAGDNGKHINITTGGVTVPSGVFSVGNVVTIYNNGSSDQTITQGSSVTLRLAGTTTTSNRTLAEHGLCTILCVASNTFVISGAGLT